jgi:hypothetical protein
MLRYRMATVMTRRLKAKDNIVTDDFSHLLESNHPPTEEESRRIRILIHVMNAEVEVLLRKKMKGERGLWPWKRANFDRRIRKLTKNIRLYAYILSIVRVIPPEIIQYIFLLSDTSPWILSRICRDWRQYALSFPPLWASLPVVRINPKSKKRSAATLQRCTEMLRYSSNAPLTLRVFALNSKLTNDPVLDLLASHSHRWHSAKIQLPPGAMATLAPAIKGGLPILQTLCLRFIWMRHDPDIPEIEAFADTPNLKSLRIEGFFSGRIQVTAPNLSHLTCNWPLPFSLSVLSQFTKLEQLHLTFGISLIDTALIPGNLITFPHLKQLSADLAQDHGFSLLQSIIAPAITEILLQLPPGDGVAHLTTMLIRSGQQTNPGIRRFQLRNKAVPASGQIVTLLRLMPELQVLGLSMPHVDDINDFSRTDDPIHVLVPKLETCTFFFEGIPTPARPSDELRSAIKAAALNRCEAPRNLNDSSWTDDLRPLRLFELGGPPCGSVIPDGFIGGFRDMMYLPLFTQADFENWTPTHRLPELVNLHKRLIEQLPHLYTGIISFGARPDGWVARVNDILDEVEALEALDPFDILVSYSS